jgi:hypothetical protein
MRQLLPILALYMTAAALDLGVPAENYESFLRTRCSLDGSEVVFYWSGEIYSFPKDEAGLLLFICDGYNISRLEPTDGGYRMLSREVFVYRDPETGSILDSWANPMTSDTVRVVHVWNDPVNALLPRRQGDWEFSMPYTSLGDSAVSWDLNIVLCYPSPLPADSFPLYSGSNSYQGSEMFHFFVRTADLEDPDLPSVPCLISWTRVGQWLPWMEMGSRPGWLLYSCTGRKLPGGYAELPADLRAFVESGHPGFTSSPDEYTRPNETSWTYFRKLLESGGYVP